MSTNSSTITQMTTLVTRARKAQETIAAYSQYQVDQLVTAIAFQLIQEETASAIARLAVEESGLGNRDGKYVKLTKKIRGVLRDIKHEPSVGVIESDERTGITKIAKPVGVIGALVPCTNPEATPVAKAMFAIKARNAIVFSPHPRTKLTNARVVEEIRTVLRRYGAPEDLVITIQDPTVELSAELMRQCDLIVATGGGPMVAAAYSSGTPAYGVGAGNAVVVVDETADIQDAAHKIMLSKTFDFATSCSAENSILAQERVYDRLVTALVSEGAYVLTEREKKRLQQTMWRDASLNREIIAQSPDRIARLAGIDAGPETRFFVVEETGVGPDSPFSGEKLSVVVALYQYREFQEAIDLVNRITSYQGRGHSCGIHTTSEDHAEALALRTKTSRVMVNQPQCYANTGNWNNGMPFTMTLGCGSWGGNISSENIGLKHFMNVTWVSRPIPEAVPSDDELFGDLVVPPVPEAVT